MTAIKATQTRRLGVIPKHLTITALFVGALPLACAVAEDLDEETMRLIEQGALTAPPQTQVPAFPTFPTGSVAPSSTDTGLPALPAAPQPTVPAPAGTGGAPAALPAPAATAPAEGVNPEANTVDPAFEPNPFEPGLEPPAALPE